MTLFGGVLAANAGLNTLIFHHARAAVGKADVLIAGDSHLQKALDPRRFVSAENTCQPAEPYVVTYWKLRYLFQRQAPRVLLLGFSHHHISAFNDRKFWDAQWATEMFHRVYPIQDFKEVKDLRVDCGEFFKIYFNRMCLYPRTDHFGFLGGYCPAEGTYLGNIQAAIDRHFYFQGQPLGVSEKALRYLDAIVALCRRHGVEPVLVGSPVHPDYYARIPPAFKAHFEADKKRLGGQGVRVLDFTATAWADDFYLDGDHLNQKGAARFTDLVIDFLGAARGEKTGTFFYFAQARI